MPLPYEEIRRRADAQAASAGPGRGLLGGSFDPAAQEDETLSLLEQAGDVVWAPFRGLEGAVQDVYGLADTLAFDVLPDYEDRVFGESRTGLGGLVEGVVQFGAGFYAAGFVPLGWTGKVGRLAPALRGAVRGAIADFATFDGHEERLSNLVQQFPALQNPISEFLAADESDSELEGRFKNALEGVGLGAVTELGLLAFKGLKAGRKARAQGLDPEGVEKAVDKAAPPEEVAQAWKKMDGHPLGEEPLPGQVGDPAAPAAIDAPNLPVDPPVLAPVVDTPDRVLRSLMTEDDLRKVMDQVHVREAPFSHATLLERDPLDPRVNPRRLTEQERLAQGMLKTDMNLSAYQGPEGALQYKRALEQVFSPIRELQAMDSRTLQQIADENMKNLAEMTGLGVQHLTASAQRDAKTLAEIVGRQNAYQVGLQSQTDYAYRKTSSALRGTDEKEILEAIIATETMADLRLAVGGIQGEFSRGLGANRIKVPFIADLFDRDAVEAALHERGGRQRALDVLQKFKTLYESSPNSIARTARVMDMAKGLNGRRAFGILNEYWYNSLLGRPTTLVVNATSNAITTVMRPLELIAGGVLTGKSEIIADGMREISGLVESASESWRAVAAALKGEGGILDPGSLLQDINNPARKAITPEALDIDPGTVQGQGIKWLGKLVRMPSAALTATDQFFQQLNYRSVARGQLVKEGLKQGMDAATAAARATGEMEKLIFRGQAYGQAMLFQQGVEDAARSGLRAKADVHKHATEFVRTQLASPEHARLSALANIAQRRSQEATFTAPLTPGTLPYRVQEAVLNHWYLRLVMPFVRTPINVIGYAADRSVRGAWGAAHLLAGRKFPKLAPSLEQTKNLLVRDMMSGDPRRKADAIGRFALGMSTTTFILMKATEATEDDLPLITGKGPSDKEQRRVLEDAGWQPYSIRVGKTYVSYGRLDPYASLLGTAADIVNYVKYAAQEDQSAVEDLSYGMAIALTNNLLNKTYLSGLANFADMLHDPQRSFPTWFRTLSASFVPGQAAAAVSATDPLLRDVRSVLDAARARWPGASDNLPPLRNVLGEPVRRAQSLGSDVSSVVNAFVPVLYREVSDDVVNKALADLSFGFTPPKRTRGGLDLSTVTKGEGGQNAFDRWLELHGEVKVGGRNLRSALRRLVTSEAYKRIPKESTDAVESPRIRMVQSVIDDYRAAAYQQTLREYPALGQAERARVQQRAMLVQGRETRPQQAPNPLLSALQGLAPRR